MPRKPNFIFEVKIRIPEAFTLDSIVREPRTFKPKDVHNACQNNELALTHGDPPPAVVELATYVMTDFFAMEHATGLYNRQKGLWEAISTVNSVHVFQQTAGLFKKHDLQIFDFHFNDYKGKPLLLVNLIGEVPEKQTPLSLLKAFISRCSGKQSLQGAVACFAMSVPDEVMAFVEKQTETTDPVGRYESIMPGVGRSFDIVQMEMAQATAGNDDAAEPRTVFQLIHPDLKRWKTQVEPPKRTYKKVPVSELPPYRDVKPHKEENETTSA